MDSYYVNLDNAKRLAEQGYKGEYPQMVWCRHYITNKPYLTFWTTSVMNKAYIPAPTHLAALEWLEKEQGYIVGMHFTSTEYGRWRWEAAKRENAGNIVSIGGRCQTPDDLIAAILDHLEGVNHD